MPCRVPLFGALLALASGATSQDSRPRAGSAAERARRAVLERAEPSLGRTAERLAALGVPAARAEEATAGLRDGLRRILSEELGLADEAELPAEARLLRASRGGFGTEPALALALDWLEAHQSPDGRWAAEGFWQNCKGKPCDGAGSAAHDVGVTGLALLALLGDASPPGALGRRAAADRATSWLLAQRDAKTGLLGSAANDRFVYDHAIATLALVEAYRLAGKGEIANALHGALVRICASRNPLRAWRYGLLPDGENDTSVTAWSVRALKAATQARTLLPTGGPGELKRLGPAIRGSLSGALDWLDQMTDAESGRCGYRELGGPPFRPAESPARFPADASESTTAAALLCRLLLGQSPASEPVLRLHADRLRRRPPVWDVTPKRSSVDEVYWFFATYAALGLGGEDWEAWNFALKKALLENQRLEGDARGSWDPAGPFGPIGGRVCSTALLALCLEAYGRGPGFFREE